MKKNTKVIGIILVLLLSINILSACSKESPASTKKGENLLEEIKNRGYMEVVTEPSFAPNEFIDPSKKGDEQYVGSDIELAKYIADKLGVELKIVPLEFTAVLGSVTEGKYDMAISALAYTPLRAEAMNLSKAYEFSDDEEGHGLLIRKEDKDKIKGVEDIADKVIVGQSGSLQEMFINEQIPKYKEFKRVSATTDGFLSVQEKKADVCATQVATAKLYIEANPDSNLMVVEGFKFEEKPETSGTRIGIPKGEEELTEKINEIIDEVLEKGLYEEWKKEYEEYAKKLGL